MQRCIEAGLRAEVNISNHTNYSGSVAGAQQPEINLVERSEQK